MQSSFVSSFREALVLKYLPMVKLEVLKRSSTYPW